MYKYVVKGGTPLFGEIEISGAKNAAVAIIPAALMVEGVCRIDNVPQISDVTMFLDIIQEMGADIRTVNRHTMDIDCSGIKTSEATFDMMRKLRAVSYTHLDVYKRQVLQASLARASILSVGTPIWYNHSRQISSPVQLRIAFFT